MGSKRTKKSKQELDILSEKNNIKNINEENSPDLERSDMSIDNNSVVQNILPKAPKRKKKTEGEEVPKKLKKISDDGNNTKKLKPRKRKLKSQSTSGSENIENEISIEGEPDVQEFVNDMPTNNKNDTDKKKEPINWPNQDITELINRMEGSLPEKDILAYRSRVEKLDWNNIAFNNYTAEECKKTWMQVQKRIRRFRLLSEILIDAKEWVNNPKTIQKPIRPKKHPDMPRRPLSSYLLFYLNTKDQIISENPGLDGSDITKLIGQIYKTLPPEKREVYEKMAASSREEYLEKLKIFFENHPEFVPPAKNHRVEKVKIEKEKTPKPEKPPKVEKEKVSKAEKPPRTPKTDRPKGEKGKPGRPPKSSTSPKIVKIVKERPPKRCQTPFGLYYASELKNMEAGTEKQVFKEKCKMQYRQMSDKKKMYWINLAEQDLIRYQEEVKAYKQKHPDFAVVKIRPILTKREKIAKERASGKPTKPPNSAYALYSRLMLQSEEIKSVNPKERMNYIANKWKNASEEEQNLYKEQVINLMEEYKAQYESYIESLPEEEKRKIIAASKKRSKKRSSKSGKNRKGRKSVKKGKPQPTKLKFQEPEQPPISACKYYATLYKGEGDPVQAWKTLPSEEKRKYEDELVKKKQAYIVEFEKFLKSLSKEELEAFSKSRQQQVKSDDEEGSSECSSDSEGDDDDENEDNENEENGNNGEDAVNNDGDGHESDSD